MDSSVMQPIARYAAAEPLPGPDDGVAPITLLQLLQKYRESRVERPPHSLSKTASCEAASAAERPSGMLDSGSSAAKADAWNLRQARQWHWRGSGGALLSSGTSKHTLAHWHFTVNPSDDGSGGNAEPRCGRANGDRNEGRYCRDMAVGRHGPEGLVDRPGAPSAAPRSVGTHSFAERDVICRRGAA